MVWSCKRRNSGIGKVSQLSFKQNGPKNPGNRTQWNLTRIGPYKHHYLKFGGKRTRDGKSNDWYSNKVAGVYILLSGTFIIEVAATSDPLHRLSPPDSGGGLERLSISWAFFAHATRSWAENPSSYFSAKRGTSFLLYPSAHSFVGRCEFPFTSNNWKTVTFS